MVDDVLGVYWWRDDDGVIHYRARGIGSKYIRFYSWLEKTSYRCTGEDWPWDFFVFDNPADHDKMVAEFGKDVYEDTYGEDEDE